MFRNASEHTETMYGRRSYKSTPRRSRRGSYRRRGSVARSKAVFKRRVLQIVQAESKFRAVSVSFVPRVGSQDEFLITNITQANSATTRVGNWIRPTSFRGVVSVIGDPGGTTATTFAVRFGVALWKNDESIDPFTTDRILQEPSAPFGPFNVVEKGSYQVLWTRTCFIVNNSDNTNLTKKVPFSINLSKIPKTLYDGGTPKKYQLFFFAASDDTAGTQPVEVFLDALLRYTDS